MKRVNRIRARTYNGKPFSGLRRLKSFESLSKKDWKNLKRTKSLKENPKAPIIKRRIKKFNTGPKINLENLEKQMETYLHSGKRNWDNRVGNKNNFGSKNEYFKKKPRTNDNQEEEAKLIKLISRDKKKFRFRVTNDKQQKNSQMGKLLRKTHRDEDNDSTGSVIRYGITKNYKNLTEALKKHNRRLKEHEKLAGNKINTAVTRGKSSRKRSREKTKYKPLNSQRSLDG